MKKVTSLKTILKMLEEKYPQTSGDPYPILLMFGDESGRIVKSVLTDTVYAGKNCIFSFASVEELVEFLQEK